MLSDSEESNSNSSVINSDEESEVEEIVVGNGENQEVDNLEKEASKQLQSAMKILNDFQRELQAQEDNNKINPHLDTHLPDNLKGSGQSADQIYAYLDSIISEADFALIKKLIDESRILNAKESQKNSNSHSNSSESATASNPSATNANNTKSSKKSKKSKKDKSKNNSNSEADSQETENPSPSPSKSSPASQKISSASITFQETKIQSAALLLKNAIANLPDHQRNNLIQKIKEDCINFLSKLYRFDSNSCKIHLEDEKDSAVYVAQKAISTKYENFETEGYLELTNNQPVIYISQAGPASLAAQICTKLGLPISCIAVVPTTATENALVDPTTEITGETKIENQENENLYNQKHEMNCAALDRMIREDISLGKKPCIVIANAGSPALGHDDPIHLLRVVCNKYKVWLHVRGPNLSTKCLSSSNIPLIGASKADSVTLRIGEWLGLPLLNSVTLLKLGHSENYRNNLTNSSLSNSNWSYNLNFVPVWLSLLILGHQGITSKALLAQDLVSRFIKRLGHNPNIDISVKSDRPTNLTIQEKFKSFSDAAEAAEKTFTEYTRNHPILVCFRLAPTEAIKASITEPLFIESEQVQKPINSDTIPEEDETQAAVEASEPVNPKESKPSKKSSKKDGKNKDKDRGRSSSKSSRKSSKKSDSESKSRSQSPTKKSKKNKKGSKSKDSSSRNSAVEAPINDPSQPEEELTENRVADNSESNLDEFLQDLYDSLNVRLYENIQSNLPKIQLDAVSLQERIFLRFTPIMSATRRGTTLANIELALDFIEKEVELSTKLITQIQAIRSAVSQSDNLDYYCDPDSFSLGLLQVVPTFLQHLEIQNLNDLQSEDLDKVNSGTLTKIQNCDTLSKLCEITTDTAGNGRTAIHLKNIFAIKNLDQEVSESHLSEAELVTKNIHKLVNLVSKYGHESEKDLLELKEFTRNIIEAKAKAEQEILKVKTKVITEETSVVQRIPIVGGIFSTIFGSKDDAEISRKMVGRSFDVQTGKMHSTKKTYTTKGQIYDQSESTAEEDLETSQLSDEEHDEVEEMREENQDQEEAEVRAEKVQEVAAEKAGDQPEKSDRRAQEEASEDSESEGEEEEDEEEASSSSDED